MPLIRIDAVEGRNEEGIQSLLNAAHRAVLSAFNVPARDRYQIYYAHPESHLIAEDTGLGIERTKNRLVVTVVSRPRDVEEGKNFYATLCRELQQSCHIEPDDIVVSIISNTEADWSFGHGRAQFITGEL